MILDFIARVVFLTATILIVIALVVGIIILVQTPILILWLAGFCTLGGVIVWAVQRVLLDWWTL